jgi:hypothetical protein
MHDTISFRLLVQDTPLVDVDSEHRLPYSSRDSLRPSHVPFTLTPSFHPGHPCTFLSIFKGTPSVDCQRLSCHFLTDTSSPLFAFPSGRLQTKRRRTVRRVFRFQTSKSKPPHSASTSHAPLSCACVPHIAELAYSLQTSPD